MIRHLGTFLVLTAVTAVIWVWAAGETREEDTVRSALRFTGPEAMTWSFSPDRVTADVVIQGSARSVRSAKSLLRQLQLELDIDVGIQRIDLMNELREHPDLKATGITVEQVDPGSISVDIDEIGSYTARVRPNLTGIQTVGETGIAPDRVTVRMPSQVRATLPDDLVAVATVEPSVLAALEPGPFHTKRAVVSLPVQVSSATIEPEEVEVTFAIRSRINETTLDSVRVHLAGPPEDHDEFNVTLSPAVLRDITIAADGDLIRRVEAGEASVVAIVHVSNRDKEQAITSKPVTFFTVLFNDADGGALVEGRTSDGLTPEIGLEITRRE